MAAKIKVYSKSELAELYGVSLSTLMTWIKPIIENSKVKRKGRFNYFTPKEVASIFEHLGFPEGT